ncbi:hypothetical protein KC343_g49 [Hortaea werneckii]|nr:hypothetical protein KC343_g49 [Hortaea werneckii]
MEGSVKTAQRITQTFLTRGNNAEIHWEGRHVECQEGSIMRLATLHLPYSSKQPGSNSRRLIHCTRACFARSRKRTRRRPRSETC